MCIRFFIIVWFLRGLEQNLLVGCVFLAALASQNGASPGGMLLWQLGSVVRQSHVELQFYGFVFFFKIFGSFAVLSEKLLFGLSQLSGLVSQYWASLRDLLFWQLKSVVRQTRFEVTRLCARVPIMVSFVRVFVREVVGWLVSVV